MFIAKKKQNTSGNLSYVFVTLFSKPDFLNLDRESQLMFKVNGCEINLISFSLKKLLSLKKSQRNSQFLIEFHYGILLFRRLFFQEESTFQNYRKFVNGETNMEYKIPRDQYVNSKKTRSQSDEAKFMERVYVLLFELRKIL